MTHLVVPFPFLSFASLYNSLAIARKESENAFNLKQRPHLLLNLTPHLPFVTQETFGDVTNVEHFWEFMHGPFAGSLFPADATLDGLLDGLLVVACTSTLSCATQPFLLISRCPSPLKKDRRFARCRTRSISKTSSVRIRQLRVQPSRNCLNIAENVTALRCYPPMTLDNVDKSPYGNSLLPTQIKQYVRQHGVRILGGGAYLANVATAVQSSPLTNVPFSTSVPYVALTPA